MVDQAVAALNRAICMNSGGDIWNMPEACDEINDASRDIVQAMAAAGECWLVKVNLSPRDITPLVRVDEDMPVYNFGASHVLPVFDQTLADMIIDRYTTPYTDTRADGAALDPILARIYQLGGQTLIWT